MGQRFYREHKTETIKKISDAMKDFHANRTIDDKRVSAEKQSMSMKRYWEGVPSKNNSEDEE